MEADKSNTGSSSGAPSPPAGSWSSRLELLRTVALVITLLGAAAFFLRFVHRSYPIQEWLFWVYLRAWGGALAFGLACLSTGNLALRWFTRRTLPLLEHFGLSVGLGVLAFQISVFLVGVLGLLKPWFFFAAPLLLIGIGARQLLQLTKRVRRHFGALRRAGRLRPPSPLRLLLALAGCFAVAALYFPIITPENVAYDVRWYHLPIAEHYVAAGAIRPSPEGWLPAAYPHLMSYLYTWAMLMPKARYFDLVELCAHVEFVLFLATLPAVTALARRLVPRLALSGAWVAIFLFPEIFAYDSTPTAGADHVAALWAPLVMLTFMRALRERSPRMAGLMATMMAGALCTKFTAASIVLFPVFAMVAWVGYRCLRPDGKPRALYLQMLGAAALAGLLATATHWLKNVIWYGDPLYPTLQGLLRVRPWTPDFSVPFQHWFYPPDYHPTRNFSGVVATFKALFTYSFVPNDWWAFHRDVPIFGSLATLSLACLPFVRGAKRIWLVQAALHVGLFFWYSVHHFDRYLQTLLPWMAASLAATMCLLWQRGTWVRLALGVLVAAQVVWGADVYFFASHAMAGSAIKKSIDLIAGGYEQNYEKRYEAPFKPYQDIAQELPANAKLLIHENHIHWALQRQTVSDWQGTQAGVSYGRLSGVRATYQLLKELGVTHLNWDQESSKGYDTLAADFNFFGLVSLGMPAGRRVGGQMVAKLPAAPPTSDFTNRSVLFMGCANTYENGLFELNDLVASDIDPKKRYPKARRALPREVPQAEVKELLGQVGLAAIDPGCYSALPQTARKAGLKHLATRNRLELYARPLVER